jgi:hypothetical protein
LTYLTGHVLKDTDAVVAWHLEGRGGEHANRPTVLDESPDALERALTGILSRAAV